MKSIIQLKKSSNKISQLALVVCILFVFILHISQKNIFEVPHQYYETTEQIYNPHESEVFLNFINLSLSLTIKDFQGNLPATIDQSKKDDLFFEIPTPPPEFNLLLSSEL